MWALSVCDISGLPLDALSVCDNSDLPSGESDNLLNMILDSGAEEHVVSLSDWKSLSEPVLKPAQVRLRSATGDDMEFLAILWCLVATRATRSLCSATKLVNATDEEALVDELLRQEHIFFVTWRLQLLACRECFAPPLPSPPSPPRPVINMDQPQCHSPGLCALRPGSHRKAML